MYLLYLEVEGLEYLEEYLVFLELVEGLDLLEYLEVDGLVRYLEEVEGRLLYLELDDLEYLDEYLDVGRLELVLEEEYLDEEGLEYLDEEERVRYLDEELLDLEGVLLLLLYLD